jgi:hypothetical protein
MSVPHGHADVLVAQDFLYLLYGCPSHNHVTSKGMSQVVKPEILYANTSYRGIERSFNAPYGLAGAGASPLRFLTGFSPFSACSPFRKGKTYSDFS